MFHKMEIKSRKSISMKDAKDKHSFAETENHYSTLIEREYTLSPLSPAFSPIKNNLAKKRKLSGDFEHTNETEHYTTVTDLVTLLDCDIYNSDDFRKFYSIMKEYVLEQNEDDTVEMSFSTAVRNIWALKHLNSIQLEKQRKEKHASIYSSILNITNDGRTKRLSNRLKTISTNKILMEQLSQIETNCNIISKQFPNSIEKRKARVRRSIEDVINDIFALDPKYLFKGMNRESICKYCIKPGNNLVKCNGSCLNYMHIECLDSSKSVESLANAQNVQNATAPHICNECVSNKNNRVCSVCHMIESTKTEDPLLICSMIQCKNAFHLSCCKYWPQAKITKTNTKRVESFRCPCHVCHTCVSDNPKEKFQHLNSTKIVKCVKCPATYHCDSTCIPAGSQILTASCIICPRHASNKADVSVNVNWCFICVNGGQLICCETCPISVHAQCVNISVDANECYICEECESGRMPLYGEIVWAKFNSFRWWPAIILPPPQVPENIAKMSHNPFDFVVRFFGSHDHGWISRRRVYLYVEGDCAELPKTKSGLDFTYKRGIEEAKRTYEIISNKKYQLQVVTGNKEKLKPQPYIRIKVNRAIPPVKLHVDMENVSKCECKPDDIAPCGPNSNCLNRALYHECNPTVCPAGELCQNRMFESRISPRLEVVYMQKRGFGLVCREFIPSGAFIIEYVGEIINDNEFKNRLVQKSNARDENFYFLSVEKDYIIDAGPKGNMARFMNHSCDPNCETQKWTVNSIQRIGLFAITDIPENTELTFNYLWDDLLGNEKKTCYCGSKKCSGQIGAKTKDFIDSTKEPSTSSNIKRKSISNIKSTPTNIKKRRKMFIKLPNADSIKRKLNISNQL